MRLKNTYNPTWAELIISMASVLRDLSQSDQEAAI